MKIQTPLFWFTLILILAVVNGMTIEREIIRSSGQPILLALVPVDPRSLMQGDYMRLNYTLLNDVRHASPTQSGRLVLSIDPQTRIATFVRIDNGEPLQKDETYLRFHRISDWQYSIGAESFFFQEGQASKFNQAFFAELRVSETGESVLVGLRDKNGNFLGEAP